MSWTKSSSWILTVILAGAAGSTAHAAGVSAEKTSAAPVKTGTPDIRSASAIAFAPDGNLLLGDSLGGMLYAIDIGDNFVDESDDPINVENLERSLSALLGTVPSSLIMGDMAVHPESQRVYMTLMRGEHWGEGRLFGRDQSPVLVRVDKKGKVEHVAWEDVRYTEAEILPSGPDTKSRRGWPERTWTVTDIAYIHGYVYLSGISNEEFSSRLRRISYPFRAEMESNSIELFHTAHGRYETEAPIDSFAPYMDGDEEMILGAFACTPLVTFPLDQEDKAHVRGKTVAELGAGNHPLDLISYVENDETYFLLANHLHPFMKIERKDIVGAGGLDRWTRRGGAPVQELPLKGIIRLAELNSRYVAALQQFDKDVGDLNLLSLAKDSL